MTLLKPASTDTARWLEHPLFKPFLAFAVAALFVAGTAFCIIGYRNATAAPLVRSLSLHVPGYPVDARPTRIVFFSDLHAHGPDMPPSRIRRIVVQINRLDPDMIVAGGDFIGDNWIGARFPVDEAIAPLAGLRARLGVYAVLGNNDYDPDAEGVAQALQRAGVRVLDSQAIRAGPIALGGIDGNTHVRARYWRERRNRTTAALEELPGVKILVAHRPDEFRWSPPWVSLVLAGHTHCGQIVLPLIGPVETGSDFGRKYLCGIIRDGARMMVVTGGVGTSHLPLRIGAPPDIWLITVSR